MPFIIFIAILVILYAFFPEAAAELRELIVDIGAEIISMVEDMVDKTKRPPM